MSLSIAALRQRLSACMNLDARRLSSRLHGVKKLPEAKQASVLETIAADLDAAEQRYQSRLAGVPRVTYPDNLPVSQKQAEIAKAISEHQVVIIAGETGSGKTTQIPKICLALGRGVKGFIGHTQPRRLAARTVAARIAEEMESETRPLCGLQGALYRSGERADPYQADDRRYLAGRDPERSDAHPVRHHHHR